MFSPLGDVYYNTQEEKYSADESTKVAEWFGTIKHSIGLEFSYAYMFVIRAGVILQPTKYAATSGVNFGFTFKYNIMDLSFAYAVPITRYNLFSQCFYISTAFNLK